MEKNAQLNETPRIVVSSKDLREAAFACDRTPARTATAEDVELWRCIEKVYIDTFKEYVESMETDTPVKFDPADKKKDSFTDTTIKKINEKRVASVVTSCGEYEFNTTDAGLYVKSCRLVGVKPLCFFTTSKTKTGNNPFGLKDGMTLPKYVAEMVRRNRKEYEPFKKAVFHDGERKAAIYTDGYFVFFSRRLYNDDFDGKVMDENGMECNCNYPDVSSAVAKIDFSAMSPVKEANKVLCNSDYLLYRTKEGLPLFISGTYSKAVRMCGTLLADDTKEKDVVQSSFIKKEVAMYLTIRRTRTISYKACNSPVVGVAGSDIVMFSAAMPNIDTYEEYAAMCAVPPYEVVKEEETIDGQDFLMRRIKAVEEERKQIEERLKEKDEQLEALYKSARLASDYLKGRHTEAA